MPDWDLYNGGEAPLTTVAPQRRDCKEVSAALRFQTLPYLEPSSMAATSSQYQGMPRILLLSLGLLLLAPSPSQQFDFSKLISTVADNVIDRLYKEGEMDLLGRYCNYSRKPYFYKWELHYRAQVTCPGWTTVVGKAEGYVNPTTAEREATRDFVRKAVNRGLVTSEEASEWL